MFPYLLSKKLVTNTLALVPCVCENFTVKAHAPLAGRGGSSPRARPGLVSVFRLRREQPIELSLAPFRCIYFAVAPHNLTLKWKCSAGICSLTVDAAAGGRARLLRRELAHLLPPPWAASLRACGLCVCVASWVCAVTCAITWSSHTLEREGIQEGTPHHKMTRTVPEKPWELLCTGVCGL